MRINQNVPAVNVYNQLSLSENRLSKSIERLSSGLRITTAADDPAGLSVSERMRRSVRGLSRSILNTQDGISLLQSAEGALNESQAVVQRIRELALQSANDSLTSNDRLEIQKEVETLRDELNNIANGTEFNTKRLLNGSLFGSVSSSSASGKGIVSGPTKSGSYQVSLTLESGGIAERLKSQTFTNYYSGDLAVGSTKLQSIAQFYDASGNMLLAQPQTITLTGNNRNTTITIDGSTSFSELGGYFSSALQNPGGLNLPKSISDAVTTASTNIAGKGGYFDISSGLPGEVGRISFSGDDSVINALGFNATLDSIDSVVKGTIIDSFGNKTSDSTSIRNLSNLLEGVDITFNSQSAQIAGSGGIVNGFWVSSDAKFEISANADVTISISGGTGVSGLWSMEGLSRSINKQISSAGVADLQASVVNEEIRISYSPALVPTNFRIYSIVQSGLKLGLSDTSYAGMATGTKESTNIVQGFSKYLTSVETVNFALYDDVTSITTIKIFDSVTTVTTADLVGISNLVSSVNAQLSGVTLAVRIDQTGDTFAFTSLNVGRTISTTGGVTQSSIYLRINTDTANAQNYLKNDFGIEESSASGIGDRNFQVTVVANKQQFQIGPEAGSTMQFGSGNMGSEALGLENLDLTSVTKATSALGKIDHALTMISSERGRLGAYQSRMEHALNNLRDSHVNMVKAESNIRDVDVAAEMIEFVREQIINQTDTAMLAQANILPEGVLQLLK